MLRILTGEILTARQFEGCEKIEYVKMGGFILHYTGLGLVHSFKDNVWSITHIASGKHLTSRQTFLKAVRAAKNIATTLRCYLPEDQFLEYGLATFGSRALIKEFLESA